jgi:hypothetical protein
MLLAMERRGDMRAGDVDREAVAERLRSALSEGRLDLPEYDERVQRAYAAKTYADLDGLLDDLPGTVPAAQARLAPVEPPGPAAPGGAPTAPPQYSTPTRQWLLATWSSYLSVVGVTTAIWLISSIAAGHLNYFWPIWVAGPWGIILLISTTTGVLGGAPHNWGGHPHSRWQDRADRRSQRRARRGYHH